jgi:hypothetical protein
MADLRPPVVGAHDRLPRLGAHKTAPSTGFHGHSGPLSITRVPTRPAAAAAAALLAGRSRSLTKLEPLGQRGLGPAITNQLLQHHGAPPTSDFGLGLGGRLRHDAPHHTTPSVGNISTPRPLNSSNPSSIIVGNGSSLLITSVGDSVLPKPFYLKNILLAPDMVQSLLSVRCFSTDNWWSMEFDPFGLFVCEGSFNPECDHQVE